MSIAFFAPIVKSMLGLYGYNQHMRRTPVLPGVTRQQPSSIQNELLDCDSTTSNGRQFAAPLEL
jgi:hypothetical protein